MEPLRLEQNNLIVLDLMFGGVAVAGSGSSACGGTTNIGICLCD